VYRLLNPGRYVKRLSNGTPPRSNASFDSANSLSVAPGIEITIRRRLTAFVVFFLMLRRKACHFDQNRFPVTYGVAIFRREIASK
jgi:hypothetical protein